MTRAPAPAAPPAVLRCRNTADFLAALPRLTGFTATRSLFVVLFSGTSAGPALRIDLPPDDAATTLGPFVDAVVALVRDAALAYGADPPAVVIASDRGFAESGGLPWRTLATGIAERFAAAGIGMRELCCTAPDGWASYLDPLVPALGYPLATIARSRVAAPAPLPELEHFGDGEPPSATEREAVRSALSRRGCAPRARDDHRCGRPWHAGGDAERTAAALVAHDELAPDALAALICASNSSSGRSAIETQITATAAAAGRTARADAYAPQMSAAADAAARVRTAALRLACAARHSPDDLRAPVLAMCGLAWCLSGLRSVARRRLDEAIALAPHDAAVLAVSRAVDLAGLPFTTANTA